MWLWLRLAAGGGLFTTLKYRHPEQCVRHECLAATQPVCLQELPGFYLKQRGCEQGMVCTSCLYGNLTHATYCICEYPPVTSLVDYGEHCGLRTECRVGRCFRPCDTFLHVTQCEAPEQVDLCMWNTTSGSCVMRPPSDIKDLWSPLLPPELGAQEGAEKMLEVIKPKTFPMSFGEFRDGAFGFMVLEVPLEAIVALDVLFVQLDTDANGLLTAGEFANLPVLLHDAELAVAAERAEVRRLAALDYVSAAEKAMNGSEDLGRDRINEDVCGVSDRQYCPLDMTCKDNCSSCGWRSAIDRKTHLCVQPTPEICKQDGGQTYCPTDIACHPKGDCSNCPSMPILDQAQSKCLEPWWDPLPRKSWTSWVCRHRRKVGMSCVYDQDCIYGMRSCIKAYGQDKATCQSLQPYNPDHVCKTDLDCPHMGYYCPSDPTFGEDPYFRKFCRRQAEDGGKCAENRECMSGTICNTVERPKVCRRYFSLASGRKAADARLCVSGWTDTSETCGPPAQSKSVGRSCAKDSGCLTTDLTGKTGRCACKQWWEGGEPKYCEPVGGDFDDHMKTMRDWLSFRSNNCGSFWTEEECIEEFGASARDLLYTVKCEIQKKSNSRDGKAYLPGAACKVDDPRYIDYCAKIGT